MRCPDCNKFVSFDAENEPEINDEAIDEEGNVTASVRIVNNCADCGTELKEANFDLEVDLTVACAEHVNAEGEDTHDLTVEIESNGRTERSDGKPGTPARYRRTYYGAECSVKVSCTCDPNFEAKADWSDEIQGSSMDELV